MQTKDGFLIGLHRLAYRRGEEGRLVNRGEGTLEKKVVYLHHGLLMCSEVWVCLTDAQRCLPFQLVERGYDVWLGNNRGNKYSKKSIHHSPLSAKFWGFSMDEFAFYDIPDSITYILNATGQASLSYIGFSQGTAQAFATLSIHPLLNQQIDVFVALAPAMAPSGLRNRIVDSLMKASPNFLFLLFGRRSILSSTTMWQTILYPPIFVRIIDTSLSILFGWEGKNISWYQKLAGYLHLYSFTSTKSVVHWFQIMPIVEIGLKSLYGEGGPPTEDSDLYLWSIPTELFKAQQIKVTAAQNQRDAAILQALDKAGFKLDMGSDNAGLLMKYLSRGGGYYIDVGGSRLIADGKIKVKQGHEITEVLPHGLQFADGTQLEADEIVFATGYQNMKTQARAIFGDEVADRIDSVWGFNEEGEMRTIWRQSGHPGFWFMGGNLALCRYYSRLLALQIKALVEGITTHGAK